MGKGRGKKAVGIDGVDRKVSYYNPLENAWRAKTTEFLSKRGCAVVSFHEEL